MAKILIIDDEDNIRATLKSALDRRGHEVVTAATVNEGTRLASIGFDVIFLDVLLPDGNGLDLLRELLRIDVSQSIVMISGHADIAMAIEAIRSGAYDFIEKPISLERVLVTIDNAAQTKALRQENSRLTSLLYGDFIGESTRIRQLKAEISRSAPLTGRFLILGENGTGKELVAHLIHRQSRYTKGPFVAVNCAALPSELVEAELFGHTAGAYTGALKARKGLFVEADHGSIFLDEISEMSLEAQAKILRVIETRRVTPVGSDKQVTVEGNIIAASNRDLEQMASRGEFRSDLLYRLNVVQFTVPPLRERREDIPLLADYFLAAFSRETKKPAKTIAPDALGLLMSYDYPGNIRELKNLMERLNIYSDSSIIDADIIKQYLPVKDNTMQNSLREVVSDFERRCIMEAIARNNGNVSLAAKELGLERSHLYKKLKKAQDS